jgi:hypothetical protein
MQQRGGRGGGSSRGKLYELTVRNGQVEGPSRHTAGAGRDQWAKEADVSTRQQQMCVG